MIIDNFSSSHHLFTSSSPPLTLGAVRDDFMGLTIYNPIFQVTPFCMLAVYIGGA
ncbi:hypothetical protein CKA32_001977 [Geitlerinema sp. FC II]|nr:hypothetical protein CKA32_001977 [Geitlerinema sp. FC II]